LPVIHVLFPVFAFHKCRIGHRIVKLKLYNIDPQGYSQLVAPFTVYYYTVYWGELFKAVPTAAKTNKVVMLQNLFVRKFPQLMVVFTEVGESTLRQMESPIYISWCSVSV